MEYARKRHKHDIFISILSFLVCGIFFLTTNIDQKLTTEYFTFSMITLFVFSRMLITFCVMYTLITIGVNRYYYIVSSFLFPTVISVNIFFRKENYSHEIFYDTSFLKMFLSGIMFYLAICNYQTAQKIFTDNKKRIIPSFIALVISFFMTLAL